MSSTFIIREMWTPCDSSNCLNFTCDFRHDDQNDLSFYVFSSVCLSVFHSLKLIGMEYFWIANKFSLDQCSVRYVPFTNCTFFCFDANFTAYISVLFHPKYFAKFVLYILSIVYCLFEYIVCDIFYLLD